MQYSVFQKRLNEVLSSSALVQRFGMLLATVDRLRQHCMCWLGQIACIDTGWVPKQIISGELPVKSLCYGPMVRIAAG